MESMESKGTNVKQEKLTNAELGKYRSFVIGLAMPVKEQPGFICVFGITTERGPGGDGLFTLLDEVESPNIINLVESLVWLTKKFSFRVPAKYPYGDHIFGDTKDMVLDDLIRKHNIKLNHSGILYGHDEQKPFMTLLPKINQARQDKVLVIGDEMLLSLRLKDEVLQNPANVQFGDSPAMESLCYAYFGWRDLIRRGNSPPQKNETDNEYDRLE